MTQMPPPRDYVGILGDPTIPDGIYPVDYEPQGGGFEPQERIVGAGIGYARVDHAAVNRLFADLLGEDDGDE
jgi:hypothetical protein